MLTSKNKICLENFVHISVSSLAGEIERAFRHGTLTKKKIDKYWQAKVRKKGFPTVSKHFATKAESKVGRVKSRM